METYTVEDAFRELEDVYEEIQTSLEAEREERLKEIGDKAIKQIVILLNAGYTETALRSALKKIGFSPQEVDYLISESWEVMEKSKWKLPKYAGLAILGLGLLILLYLTYAAFTKIQSVPCSSVSCVNEIVDCSSGNYYYKSGTIEKSYTIKNQGSECYVYIRVYKALNRSMIGEWASCRFKIESGGTDVDPSKCEGNKMLL